MALYFYSTFVNKGPTKMEKRFPLFFVFFWSHGKNSFLRVPTGYFGTKYFKKVRKKGRILILYVVLNDTNFLLINLCNSNSEPDQLCTLSTLQKLLEK